MGVMTETTKTDSAMQPAPENEDRLLLHACCGPCSLEPVRILRSEGVEPVVFYANSNIHPAEEYAHRLATLREWAADADLEVVEGAYDPDKWEATVGRIGNAAEAKYGVITDEEGDLEGDASPARAAREARCRACYRLRFEEAARYARENNVPFLGICLGLQAAVCSFARDVCGLEGATSAEFADAAPEGTPLVIDLMPEQEDVEDKGGTMRLGAYPCKVVPGTRAAAAYGEPIVYERHRHRYEVNNAYRDALAEGGLVISGLSPDERLVEMIELPDHPFFVASQAHPEFKSRPTNPHPLFRAFVEAANERKAE